MNDAQSIGRSSFAAHARKLGDGEARARWRHEIVRLAHSGHDLPTLLDKTVRVLRKAIPCEAGCWHALDPATLLETSYRAINLPIENPLAAANRDPGALNSDAVVAKVHGDWDGVTVDYTFDYAKLLGVPLAFQIGSASPLAPARPVRPMRCT